MVFQHHAHKPFSPALDRRANICMAHSLSSDSCCSAADLQQVQPGRKRKPGHAGAVTGAVAAAECASDAKRPCGSPLSVEGSQSSALDVWHVPDCREANCLAPDFNPLSLPCASAEDPLLCEEEAIDEAAAPAGSAVSSASAEEMHYSDEFEEEPSCPMSESEDDGPWCTSNFRKTPCESDHFTYRAVCPETLIATMATMYGFSPFCISVGTSYFQRLASADRSLRQAALMSPDFAPFVEQAAVQVHPQIRKPVGHPLHSCQTLRHWLLAVHLTCIYIAAKNVEMVPYKHLLRTMLQNVHGLEVTPDQAAALELEVLVGLEWRLGPYFRASST